MEASEKRHDQTNTTIRDHQALMRDQQSLPRNHQASIWNIKSQLGQLTTLVNEWLSQQIPNKKPQPHDIIVDTIEDTISEFLESIVEAPRQSGP